MRYIKFLGNNKYPIPKNKKRNLNIQQNISQKTPSQNIEEPLKITKDKIIISGITTGLDSDRHVTLLINGDNLPIDKEYNWMINFDNISITPSTQENFLILSNGNSNKYKSASNVSVIINVDDYISDIIKIK